MRAVFDEAIKRVDLVVKRLGAELDQIKCDARDHAQKQRQKRDHLGAQHHDLSLHVAA